ncbi:MAG: hypothetical protein AABZ41_04930 [Bacteroidota bacterium]
MSPNYTLRMFVAGGLAVLAVGCQSTTGPVEVQQSYVHYRAAWSPDGATLAFLANINNTLGIYAVDSSGSNIRLIYAGDTGGPTWSPDSKWLAFSKGLSLYKIKANGDSLKQITVSANDIRPSWSRDGKLIAYERSGSTWLYNVTNDSIRSLISPGYFPSWHPNGMEVVLMVPSSTSPVYFFYAVRVDSASNRLLISISTNDDLSFASISPSGQHLIFTLSPYNDIAGIWKADLSNGAAVKLTVDGGDFASWSPDGSKIVYTRTQAGDGALWIMSSDGTGKRRLTSP